MRTPQLAAQLPAFPPIGEILPRTRDAAVIAAPRRGNASPSEDVPIPLPAPAGRPALEVPMKIVRWTAAAALTLVSLMDIGVALGGGEIHPVRTLAPLLGMLGLAATYGLLRRRQWGAPAALAAAAINVVSALIAMALSSAGALTGLAVSLVALALTAVAAYTGQASRPHAQAGRPDH